MDAGAVVAAPPVAGPVVATVGRVVAAGIVVVAGACFAICSTAPLIASPSTSAAWVWVMRSARLTARSGSGVSRTTSSSADPIRRIADLLRFPHLAAELAPRSFLDTPSYPPFRILSDKLEWFREN